MKSWTDIAARRRLRKYFCVGVIVIVVALPGGEQVIQPPSPLISYGRHRKYHQQHGSVLYGFAYHWYGNDDRLTGDRNGTGLNATEKQSRTIGGQPRLGGGRAQSMGDEDGAISPVLG